MAAPLTLTVGQECFLTAMKRVMVVEVLGLSEDSIWVSYPTSDIIKDGTGIELTFKTENGFVGFHARVSAGPKVNQKEPHTPVLNTKRYPQGTLSFCVRAPLD